jgi:hypothetical protein
VIVADLALILFLTTLAGLARAEETGSGNAHARFAEAQLIYRPAAGVPKFSDWLEESAPDPRMQVTIYVTFEGSPKTSAYGTGIEMLGEAQRNGYEARLIVARGGPAETYAVIAFDQAGAD